MRIQAKMWETDEYSMNWDGFFIFFTETKFVPLVRTIVQLPKIAGYTNA